MSEYESELADFSPERDRSKQRQLLRRQILDARELLAYATATGRPIPDSVVETIASVAASDLGLADAPEAPGQALNELPSTFEKAYRDLAAAVAPVTVDSLRATVRGSEGWSLSRRWSRTLWIVTLLAGVTIYAIENLGSILQNDDQSTALFTGHRDTFELAYVCLKGLVPFGYGLLGACAYLLRSCHAYIRDRTFDPLYIPEYWNRLLLGAVGGGMILFFADWLQNAEGTVQLSSAALAFVGGYNSDILFTLIERIKDAILPKAPTPPAPTKSTTSAK